MKTTSGINSKFLKMMIPKCSVFNKQQGETAELLWF